MTNPFYTATGNPPAQTRGTSSPLRAEFLGIQTGFDGVNATVNAKGAIAGQVWTGTHDFTGATEVKVPTPTAIGDAVTKEYADGLAFATALPAQAGNAGKFINTNGVTASWLAVMPQIIRSPRTSNTILAVADQTTFVDITSGTFAQTFVAAVTLGTGWYICLRNSGAGDVTLSPTAGLIDGLSSYIMYPGETRLIQCDGTNFTSIILHPYSRVFTTTGIWTIPPGYSYHGGLVWSAGASGGRTNSVSTLCYGGGGGGCAPFALPSNILGSSQIISIGAGGTSFTGVSALGTPGGNTTIGSLFAVYSNANSYYGGSVVQGLVSSSQTVGFEGNQGGGAKAIYGGDGSAVSGVSGGSIYGGGAGGSVNSSAVALTAGASVFGGSGGASSSAASGFSGTTPGGGGGATQTGTSSGAGARGEVRIWGIV